MKYADIEKIQEAGLITAEQRQQIIDHFRLKQDSNKFLTIISYVGAVLVASGIIMLIAANWDGIPRGVKIAAGLLLMLGAHAGGWYLREINGHYRKSGEALHMVGSALFLGNIALLGQIYNLSERPPNAFLLWFLGIAPLPWLLRSRAQHILSLLAFGVWFGFEVNQQGSPIFFGDDIYQILLFALMGLIYLGAGYCLRRTAFAEFAPATEKLGLFAFVAFAFPVTWGIFFREHDHLKHFSAWIFPGLSALALVLLLSGIANLRDLTRQWRWTWSMAVVGMLALLAGALYFAPLWAFGTDRETGGYHWIFTIAFFVFLLLQIQVGIQERSVFMVNLGLAFIAFEIIAVYVELFGSMTQTGLMFLVGGVGLILLSIILEKQRRVLLKQIRTAGMQTG